ncbi:MAG: hypothetical protein L0241_11025 [Planctomycetia bacterium]|nr:hypothetical protein [Planctomycetia bacterium]
MITWKAHSGDVRGVEFSPDGKQLATYGMDDSSARMWNPVERKEVAAFQMSGTATPSLKPTVYCIAFSRCGAYFALGGWAPNENDMRVLVWELASEKLVAPLLRPVGVDDLAFTPGDPPGLLVVDGNRLNHFANALDPKENAKPVVYSRGPDRKTPKCSRVILSSDLRWVATNGRYKAVVWDAKTLKPKFVREHPRGPQNGPAAFDPACEVLAVAHGTKVDLWRFSDPNAKAVELAGHKLPVWAVGFLPDGQTVQTASSDGTIRLWDATTGSEKKRYDFGLGTVFCAAFAPDGLTCAAGGSDGKIVMWDVDA